MILTLAFACDFLVGLLPEQLLCGGAAAVPLRDAIFRQPLAVRRQQERRRRLGMKTFLGQGQKIRFSTHYLTASVLG